MNNTLLRTTKYTIPAFILTIGVCTSLFIPFSPVFSGPLLILYLFFFGFHLGTFLLPKEQRLFQGLMGCLSLLSANTIFLSAIYWFYELNVFCIVVSLILIPFLIALLPHQEITPSPQEEEAESSSFLGTKLGILLFYGGEMILFATLIEKRYTDTLISPWTIIGPTFFFLFTLLTALLFYLLQQPYAQKKQLLLLLPHFGIFCTVALFLFAYGFGFDPFIHQATETWIRDHGFILPKQPYYIGQYMLVLFLHFTTHISLHHIDAALVPVGASILIPLFAYFAYTRKGYTERMLPAIAFLPFIPLPYFIATTPNNTALLIAALLTFWMWYESAHETKTTVTVGFLLAGMAMTIHPFIGIPLIVIYAGYHILHTLGHQYRRLFSLFYSFLLITVTPLLFFLNALRSGETVRFQNPTEHIAPFLRLFTPPFWYWYDSAPLHWQVLYIYKMMIVPIALLLIGIGAFLAIKKYKESIASFFLMSAFCIAVSACIVGTAVQFPNVISYEQTVYADRLLDLTVVILFPFFLFSVRWLFLRVKEKPLLQLAFSCAAALLLLISWYFTYPTRDPVSRYTGYNVRQADIDAVHFIANRNPGKEIEYIVLSNQMVAAAALREFSFAKYFNTPLGEQYFYSIPTGGPFYEFFRKMVYEQPKRQWMEDAMRFAGVQKAYFIHTSYWAPAAEIRDAAKSEADAWWELGNGRVWVYEYTLRQ
ncbi:MAG TPA: hypothetical protein VEA18_00735 [Candidatus Kapabacteria bacterium]|nr:hypothetical protein [Candidatus Kapabacteria bacterium]